MTIQTAVLIEALHELGADEDEIMDNIYGHYAKEGRTPSGHKTGQKLLMKDDAKVAAGTTLEAAHKLKPAEVPGYLDAHFESAWDHFDQNHEGWIRYEETHTFQRFLNGQLNKFSAAPVRLTHFHTQLLPRLSQSVPSEDESMLDSRQLE